MAVYSVPCLNLNYSIIPSKLIMLCPAVVFFFFFWLIIKIPIKNHMPEFLDRFLKHHCKHWISSFSRWLTGKESVWSQNLDLLKGCSVRYQKWKCPKSVLSHLVQQWGLGGWVLWPAQSLTPGRPLGSHGTDADLSPALWQAWGMATCIGYVLS